MKYYKIMHDENGTMEDMVCFSDKDYENKYSVKGNYLYEGKIIKDWNPDFTFYYNSEEGYRPTDYLPNNLSWLLVSSKFVEIIKKIGVREVQFLPVVIKEVNTGKIIEGYSVLNITRLTNAIDLPNSLYTEIEARDIKVISVIKYALNKNKLKGSHLVRLKAHKFATFISDEIKNELEKNKITGFGFLEVKVV
ncbi:hypothetical protein SH2C18_34620 [Clostridium sediminicola]|uniref:imm11 family protein n=1 Tax=Clostridium sediminicola TaxID=3114879 RepID=UPI0031F25B57